MSATPPPSHYELLGLSPDASDEQIRQAWRDTARRLHPDTAGEGATDAFLAARYAYEVLVDPRSRRQYDVEQLAVRLRFRPDPQPSTPAPPPTPQHVSTTTAPPGPTGATRPTQKNPSPSDHGDPGATLHATITIDFPSAVFGVTVPLIISRRQPCRTCAGRPPRTGCASCGHEGFELLESTVNVVVPPGTTSGTSIVVPESGDIGQRAGTPGARHGLPGPAGDLVVETIVTPTPGVLQVGSDLIYDLPIDVIDALLGTLVYPQLMDGPATVVVPPGAEPNLRLRLSGRGVPAALIGTRGDAYVEVRIVMRTNLSPAERQSLEALRRSS